MPTKKEIARLRELLRKANAEGEFLTAAEKGRQLTNLLAYLESAVLLARRMAEEQPQLPIHQSARSPVWPVTEIAGSIETNEFGWLHITLNTLLPHCRFKTPAYLSDTITRLVESHQAKGGRVPFFRKAILIIDEHCDLKNRQVFDQDNKGWKAIPNALKGLVVEDDDQQSLELALLSTSDSEAACHIYVMDTDDAGEFFSIRSGQYGYFL